MKPDKIMKPDKSTYETPAMLCKMFSTEAGFAASLKYGNAGSDGRVVIDGIDYYWRTEL